jgi:AraC-like DNA-binding protein
VPIPSSYAIVSYRVRWVIVELDVLSDVISVVRSGRPLSALVTWRAPWGQRFASESGSAGFHVILQGTCWLVQPGVEPILLSAGDVLFFPGGGEHVLADHPSTPPAPEACSPEHPRFANRYVNEAAPPSDGAVTVVLGGAYWLEPSRTHPLLRDLPRVIHLPARLGHCPELRAAIDLLSAELERPRIGTYAIIPALLDTLLLYILRAWFDEQPATGSGGWAAALRDPAVAAALHAIHRAPEHPWTVASLAQEAGLSRAPFARRFAALVGQPPLSYLTWWRLTTAARLLVDSEAPLGAIASAVGYSSEFAFANAFKRQHGMAPGRYRRTA